MLRQMGYSRRIKSNISSPAPLVRSGLRVGCIFNTGIPSRSLLPGNRHLAPQVGSQHALHNPAAAKSDLQALFMGCIMSNPASIDDSNFRHRHHELSPPFSVLGLLLDNFVDEVPGE